MNVFLLSQAQRRRHGRFRPRCRSRHGLTLVELLIVITIAVVLLAVAIPLAKQPLEQQKVREASRHVNALIASAQARAVELNRPVGLLFEPRDAGPVAAAGDVAAVNASEGITRVHFAEVPPLYGGDVTGAQAVVRVDSGNYFVHFDVRSYAGVLAFVGVGDHIRFGYRGRWFTVNAQPEIVTVDQEVRVRIAVNAVSVAELAIDRLVPFQIQRRPRKSVRPPVDLPADTVVDLVGSGVGNSATDFGVWFDAPNNTWQRFGYPYVMIMFQPSGAVDTVHYGNTVVRPSAPIHFLVGRADQVIPSSPFDASGDDSFSNLRDPEALWVSIGHTTGKVTTTENLPTDNFTPDPNSPFSAIQQRILASRTLAMTSQSKGGR